MIVVGFDLSLTVSGCALVEVAWQQVDVGDRSIVFEAVPQRWSTWRGRAAKPEVPSVDGTRRRLRTMIREVLALVPDAVDLSVVEGPSFGSRTALSLADERSGLRWMLIDQLLARGPVAVVAPTTRALLAAGNGRAKKAAVAAAMRSRYPDVHIPDHNVADAVALAEAGAARLGMPVGYSTAQASAHAKVAWPVGGGLVLAGNGEGNDSAVLRPAAGRGA